VLDIFIRPRRALR